MGEPRVRRAARTVGVAFLLVGCLGFVPGAALDLEQIHLTGPGSATTLLGALPVTVAGNVVHLVLAVAALPCLQSDSRARGYLVWGGVLYAVLCLRSIAVGTGTVGASAGASGGLWLAVAAGIAMMAAGWVTTGAPVTRVGLATGIRRTG